MHPIDYLFCLMATEKQINDTGISLFLKMDFTDFKTKHKGVEDILSKTNSVDSPCNGNMWISRNRGHVINNSRLVSMLVLIKYEEW